MATSRRGGSRSYGNAKRDSHRCQDPRREQIRQQLSIISEETKDLIPLVLDRTQECSDGFLIHGPGVPRLKAENCPGFTGVRVRVMEQDTFDAAIHLTNKNDQNAISNTTATSANDNTTAEPDYGHTCILNMASAKRPGGGWLSGAAAQEESLCRRSTLIETLKEGFYRIPKCGAIYSPSVVVFRSSRALGHKLMDLDDPDSLPIVSAISVAALVRPPVKTVRVITGSNNDGGEAATPSASSKQVYERASDRETMKDKMRLILRVSASKGHRRIVLGAFGCGAFGNPREDAADCWAEVFGEAEFQGGWWKDVIFAILDPPVRPGQNQQGCGNAGAYIGRLDGLPVSPQ
ncbi:uncharacterized protein GIQ15_06752 [Arthroderma uncinatum]|uniref:uncharacterized protein n=1 Tax=Arthroderma uncinatum TaxID=74035 RepID=UPI00144ABE10|nr:uncharacterized protein GIQ15_06752 [Arthroderma uncinatum]KAF3479776.1 hypothetical protein GIQ15_06752 [Arthroderma uncinatum]